MDKKHIALITDDNYCFPTIICIKSLIGCCSPTNNYIIHVCSFGLSDSNKDKLTTLSTSNATVVIDQFYEKQYEDRIKQVSQKTHVTPTALIKFELSNYFKGIDKILYIDGDIIIKDNIDELLDLDLSGNYLAASYDFYRRLNKINYSFKRDYDDFYFNSGVMLLNLHQMRLDGVAEKLWYYKLNCSKTKLMDQESLNAVCGSHVIPLSIIWNFNPAFLEERYIEEINNVYKTSFVSLEHLEESVRIIHYVGKPDKPWIYKGAKFRQYWDRAFNEYDETVQLDLQTFERANPTFLESAKSKIQLFGFHGFMCFIINRLRHSTII